MRLLTQQRYLHSRGSRFDERICVTNPDRTQSITGTLYLLGNVYWQVCIFCLGFYLNILWLAAYCKNKLRLACKTKIGEQLPVGH